MCTAREASQLVLRALPTRILSCGALLLSFAPAGISTYEWNKGEEYMRMAALATHKREEVSVEELRAMQYTQRE